MFHDFIDFLDILCFNIYLFNNLPKFMPTEKSPEIWNSRSTKLSGKDIESQIHFNFGVDQTLWTPEQLKFHNSLTEEKRKARWDDLPKLVEKELGDRIEALLLS